MVLGIAAIVRVFCVNGSVLLNLYCVVAEEEREKEESCL